MSESVSDPGDLLFPGAHPQVPGARSGSNHGAASAPASPANAVPLDALRERSADGWVVRLRVHAERVTVSKQVVTSQRVVLRRTLVDDVVHVEAEVQREQLRVETAGHVEIMRSGGSEPGEPLALAGDAYVVGEADCRGGKP